MKKYTNLIIVSVIWIGLISLSFSFSYKAAVKEQESIVLQAARSLFDMVVLTRLWNAQHHGVYVPITKETPSNPYLDEYMRDIKVNDSLTLTKINPAYMTRQIGEMSEKLGGIQIHITSLKPLRPENKATPLESRFLREFEDGKKEAGIFLGRGDSKTFFYMAPLAVKTACLACHAKDGYKLNDIRGGVSVTLPFTLKLPVVTMTTVHFGIGIIGLIGIIFAVTKLQNAYQTISTQASIDALTNIPNRANFTIQIAREFSRNRRINSSISLIMCDIDNFKLLNDTFGHTYGDTCLKAVAQTIKSSLKRPADFCARYGGEEFIIILSDTNHIGATQIAEKIRLSVEQLRVKNESQINDLYVTISLGVSTSNGETPDSYEKLIHQADKAMYMAKELGRNQVQSYKKTIEKQ
ncbi:MAG: diguanylate cyclase [Gammaproteobacteria bacterium]|nr:diguanylate cyclase [Gammaproteobacteria bacterium]